jgi:protein dithiol oxidoreductase (disulfide-forming)
VIRSALGALLLLLAAATHAGNTPQPDILEKYAQYISPIEVDWDIKPPYVVEFFSYNCNYCFAAEALVDHFVDSKPAGLTFQRLHVSASAPAWQHSQVAFATASLLGAEPRIHDELFHRFNVDKRVFESLDEVRSYFSQGPLGEQAAALVGSEQVAALRAGISRKIKESGLNRVPAFVVNGRYLVYWGSEMTREDFTGLLLALSTRQACETACAAPQ